MRPRTAPTPRVATVAVALLGLLLALLSLGTPAHAAPTGFRIDNGRLAETWGITEGPDPRR